MSKFERYGQKPPRLHSEQLKNSIRPLDFYRHELPNVTFKTIAWNDGGLCPFHSDNNTGSFRVNLTTGAFICYACGVKGSDIISFTMQLHGLSFIDAMKKINAEWVII